MLQAHDYRMLPVQKYFTLTLSHLLPLLFAVLPHRSQLCTLDELHALTLTAVLGTKRTTQSSGRHNTLHIKRLGMPVRLEVSIAHEQQDKILPKDVQASATL